jgi:hypothetical protein
VLAAPIVVIRGNSGISGSLNELRVGHTLMIDPCGVA